MRQEGDSCNAVIGVFYASMIDVARCGAVRCGAVRCGAVRCGAAWRGVAWRGVAWMGACHCRKLLPSLL